MGSITTKRSVMTCFTDSDDIYCHQVRIVLAEKGVNVEVIEVDTNNPPEELLMLNPYQSLPTLVDRDLVIYSASIIMEYLDERFPHPPLLPVYPVARAKTRLMMSRIEEDWYSLVNIIDKKVSIDSQNDSSEHNSGDNLDNDLELAKKQLLDSLLSINSVFTEHEYFLSDDFSLVDCCIAPLLWRLNKYGIELPKQAEAIIAYQNRIFARNSFQVSLTNSERLLREEQVAQPSD